MTAGILGVPLGSYLSTKLSKKSPRSDPVICAIGLLLSAPLIAGAMLMVTVNSTVAYILVFLGEIALNCNWAIVADMLLVRILQMYSCPFYVFNIPVTFKSSFMFHSYLEIPSCHYFMICKHILIAIMFPSTSCSHFISDDAQTEVMELVKWQRILFLLLCSHNLAF